MNKINNRIRCFNEMHDGIINITILTRKKWKKWKKDNNYEISK